MVENLKVYIEKNDVIMGHVQIEVETERMSAEVQMRAESGQDIREMLKAIDIVQAVFSGQISNVRAVEPDGVL